MRKRASVIFFPVFWFDFLCRVKQSSSMRSKHDLQTKQIINTKFELDEIYFENDFSPFIFYAQNQNLRKGLEV